MKPILLSCKTLITMHRLVTAIHRDTGRHFELAQESSLLGLLSFAAFSKSESVLTAFFQLITEMTENERKALSSRGLDLSAYLSTQQGHSELRKNHVYRGQTHHINQSEKKKSSHTRVYRGQTLAKDKQKSLQDK